MTREAYNLTSEVPDAGIYNTPTTSNIIINTTNTTTTVQQLVVTWPSQSALAASFALYVLPLLVGTLGNAGIVHVIASQKSLRTGVNAYIANMAVVDLLACVLLVPLRLLLYLQQGDGGSDDGQTSAAAESTAPGFLLCESQIFVHSLVDCGRMLFLSAVSFERYQAVANPFHRDKATAARRAAVTLAALWGLTLIYAVLVTLFFYDTLMFELCVNASPNSAPTLGTLNDYSLWGLTELFFILPLSFITVLVVVVCYLLMFRLLQTQRIKMQKHQQQESHVKQNQVAPAPPSPNKTYLPGPLIRPPSARQPTHPLPVTAASTPATAKTIVNGDLAEAVSAAAATNNAEGTTGESPASNTRAILASVPPALDEQPSRQHVQVSASTTAISSDAKLISPLSVMGSPHNLCLNDYLVEETGKVNSVGSMCQSIKLRLPVSISGLETSGDVCDVENPQHVSTEAEKVIFSERNTILFEQNSLLFTSSYSGHSASRRSFKQPDCTKVIGGIDTTVEASLEKGHEAASLERHYVGQQAGSLASGVKGVADSPELETRARAEWREFQLLEGVSVSPNCNTLPPQLNTSQNPGHWSEDSENERSDQTTPRERALKSPLVKMRRLLSLPLFGHLAFSPFPISKSTAEERLKTIGVFHRLNSWSSENSRCNRVHAVIEQFAHATMTYSDSQTRSERVLDGSAEQAKTNCRKHLQKPFDNSYRAEVLSDASYQDINLNPEWPTQIMEMKTKATDINEKKNGRGRDEVNFSPVLDRSVGSVREKPVHSTDASPVKDAGGEVNAAKTIEMVETMEDVLMSDQCHSVHQQPAEQDATEVTQSVQDGFRSTECNGSTNLLKKPPEQDTVEIFTESHRKTVTVVEMDGTAHVEQVSQNIHGDVCILNPKNRIQGRRRVELKVAKRLVIIFITFLFLWLPYPLAVLSIRLTYLQPQRPGQGGWGAQGLTSAVAGGEETSRRGLWLEDPGVRQILADVTTVLSALTTLTAAVNPLLYGLANVTIRSVILARLKAARRRCCCPRCGS